MLDATMRILARFLTPMFFAGMIGSTLIVLLTFGSDFIHFFADDGEDPAGDPPR